VSPGLPHRLPATPPVYHPERRGAVQPKPAAVSPQPNRLSPPAVFWPHSAPRHSPHNPNAVSCKPAHRTAIQPYTTAGTRKFSQNNHYVVDSANDTILYVRPGATAPQPGLIVATGHTTNINGVHYNRYHYNPANNFVNDCLSFAENLARNTDANSARAEFRAVGDRPTGTSRLFGQSDDQNVDIAGGSWVQDESANPAIGEAYAIARTAVPGRGETPYHVALVVAKDGSDNVTLEADASVVRAAPVFDIYDSTPSSNALRAANSLTFYETYEGAYTSIRRKGKKRTRHMPSAGVLRLRTD
jgi:hypothetical protein